MPADRVPSVSPLDLFLWTRPINPYLRSLDAAAGEAARAYEALKTHNLAAEMAAGPNAAWLTEEARRQREMQGRVSAGVRWRTEEKELLAARVQDKVRKFQYLHNAASAASVTEGLAARLSEAAQRGAVQAHRLAEATQRMDAVLRSGEVLRRIDSAVSRMASVDKQVDLDRLGQMAQPLAAEMSRRNLGGTLDTLLARTIEDEAGVEALTQLLDEMPALVTDQQPTEQEVEAAAESLAAETEESAEAEEDLSPSASGSVRAAKRVRRLLAPENLPDFVRGYLYGKILDYVLWAGAAFISAQVSNVQAIQDLLNPPVIEEFEPANPAPAHPAPEPDAGEPPALPPTSGAG